MFIPAGIIAASMARWGMAFFSRQCAVMIILSALVGEPLLANKDGRSSIEPITLPANWRNLDPAGRFAVLRNSPRLVRGHKLANVIIDCRRRNVTDLDSGYAMHFNYPGREDGSFTFSVPHGRSVRGDLEILSSDAHRYDRIFVLSGTSSRVNAKKGPGGLTLQEIAEIASLLETFQNHCSPAQGGRHIDVHAILADRER